MDVYRYYLDTLTVDLDIFILNDNLVLPLHSSLAFQKLLLFCVGNIHL